VIFDLSTLLFPFFPFLRLVFQAHAFQYKVRCKMAQAPRKRCAEETKSQATMTRDQDKVRSASQSNGTDISTTHLHDDEHRSKKGDRRVAFAHYEGQHHRLQGPTMSMRMGARSLPAPRERQQHLLLAAAALLWHDRAPVEAPLARKHTSSGGGSSNSNSHRHDGSVDTFCGGGPILPRNESPSAHYSGQKVKQQQPGFLTSSSTLSSRQLMGLVTLGAQADAQAISMVEPNVRASTSSQHQQPQQDFLTVYSKMSSRQLMDLATQRAAEEARATMVTMNTRKLLSSSSTKNSSNCTQRCYPDNCWIRQQSE
jgi:hypothetical protein